MLNPQSIKRIIFLGIAFTLLSIAAQDVIADETEPILVKRWTKSMTNPIGDMAVANLMGDSNKELVVGLKNNTVYIFDYRGNIMKEFSLGNASRIGGINDIEIEDVDEDGQKELIFALGGAKTIRQYEAHAFTVDPDAFTLTPDDKVLYRVTRYQGGVYVTEIDGGLVWRHLTLDSVRSVTYLRTRLHGNLIAAGVGDLMIMVYNEKTGELIEGSVCLTEEIKDEESGWTEQSDCLNPDKCCAGRDSCRNCKATWNDDYKTPDKCTRCKEDTAAVICERRIDCQKEEVCTRTYESTVCATGVTGDTVGWRYVSYKSYNSSIYLLEKDGRLKTKYLIELKDNETNKAIEDVDNTIRQIISQDLNNDGNKELIIASNNGEVSVLNVTNIESIQQRWHSYIGEQIRRVASADISEDTPHMETIVGNSLGDIVLHDINGNIMWKQKAEDAITGIKIADVELDGSLDIIVSSRDNNLYVFDYMGNILWTYFTRLPVYGIEIDDLNNNGLQEFITYTDKNITVYETNSFYIKKFKADNYYKQAFMLFDAQDYTKASIYIDIARNIYVEIEDRESVPKCDLLRARIDEEFRVRTKREGDRYYTLALNYYAVNNIEMAKVNLESARVIFEKIPDEDGLLKVRNMVETIEDDAKNTKKITADGNFQRAVSISAFGNISGALELLDLAREIYVEIGFQNDTNKVDNHISEMGEREYGRAQTAFTTYDFETSYERALVAKMLYERVHDSNMSEACQILADHAKENIGKDPSDAVQKNDYRPVIVVVLVVAIVLVLIVKKKQSSEMQRYVHEMDRLEEEKFDKIPKPDVKDLNDVEGGGFEDGPPTN